MEPTKLSLQNNKTASLQLRYRLSADRLWYSFYQFKRTLAKAGFNFDQPRDDHGRWTSAGGGSDVRPDYLETLPQFEPAGYNGDYHDTVVDHVAKDLRAKGYTVEKEVRLILPGDPPVMARIDLLHRSPEGEVRGVEIKTGERPSFTGAQAIVYPHVVGGAGVISPDYKIGSLSLTAGLPLPAIPIDLGRVIGNDIFYITIVPELKSWHLQFFFSRI